MREFGLDLSRFRSARAPLPATRVLRLLCSWHTSGSVRLPVPPLTYPPAQINQDDIVVRAHGCASDGMRHTARDGRVGEAGRATHDRAHIVPST